MRDNLHDLKCVMDYLGEYWDVVYSDWIDDPERYREMGLEFPRICKSM